jgi:hypothetical protein
MNIFFHPAKDGLSCWKILPFIYFHKQVMITTSMKKGLVSTLAADPPRGTKKISELCTHKILCRREHTEFHVKHASASIVTKSLVFILSVKSNQAKNLIFIT